jgi:hypothetical protein
MSTAIHLSLSKGLFGNEQRFTQILTHQVDMESESAKARCCKLHSRPHRVSNYMFGSLQGGLTSAKIIRFTNTHSLYNASFDNVM